MNNLDFDIVAHSLEVLIEINDLNTINPDDDIVTEGAFYLLNAFSNGNMTN